MLRYYALTCLAVALLLLTWGCTPRPAAESEDQPPMRAETPEDEAQAAAGEDEEQGEDSEPEPAPELPDDQLQAKLDEAQELIDSDDWDGALGVYDELASLAPNRTEVWVGRGVVLRGLAQPADGELDDRLMEEAIGNFTTAIELDDALAEAHYERGQAYSIVGRTYFMEAGDMGQRGEEALTAARSDFRKALELNPDDAQTLLARGEVHEALGDYYNAIKDFERVLDLIPGNTTAQQGIARCEESLDD